MDGKGSGAAAAFDLALAEEARRRRQRSGLSFRSVRQALGWYWEMRERMSSAHGLHPRGERGPGGQMVWVQVDGGRGGDLDEVLATLATIHRALEVLRRQDVRGWKMLELCWRDGVSQAEVGRRFQVSQKTVSVLSGKAEAYLAGWFSQGGVML